jgi:hypothetical protein
MTDITARRLVAGTAALVVTDVAGGLLAVAGDVNTWSEAWGGEALLAAPWPMILAQVLLTWVATRKDGRLAVVAAALLAAACLVSAISGFFDGGLGNDRLSSGLVAFQVFLLAVTATVGILAALRAVAARPGGIVTDEIGVNPGG